MKEQNKVLRGIGIVLSILLVVASFYLLYQLIKINVLPTKFLFLITIIFVLLDAIFALLLCYYTRARRQRQMCIRDRYLYLVLVWVVIIFRKQEVY